MPFAKKKGENVSKEEERGRKRKRKKKKEEEREGCGSGGWRIQKEREKGGGGGGVTEMHFPILFKCLHRDHRRENVKGNVNLMH